MHLYILAQYSEFIFELLYHCGEKFARMLYIFIGFLFGLYYYCYYFFAFLFLLFAHIFCFYFAH